MIKRGNVEALECSWQQPPMRLDLYKDDIHLWRARLYRPQWQIQLMEKYLSPEEKQKANRFYFNRDRRCYISAHGLLRSSLGLYFGIDPDRVVFLPGTHGKPVLAPVGTDEILYFNLSHSFEMALACRQWR